MRFKAFLRRGPGRTVLLLGIGTVIVALALAAPRMIAGGTSQTFKFVRLVDDGAMPVITDALNREAERGWELAEMSVTPGDPGVIYLVFKK